MKNNNTYIIAEAGVNHNGDLKMAFELIKQAKLAGADCVKFQTFKAERIVSSNAPKANYQLKTTSPSESQFDMLKKLELTKSDFEKLKLECDSIGIDFMSTPYNTEDIKLLNDIGVKMFKVASGQLTEHYFLQELAKYGKPIILSTGMATLAEVFDAVEKIKAEGVVPCVLQCTTNYPSLIEESNILAMLSIRDACQVPIGYSDHVSNNFACYAAVANGARIIEKHFTLDNNLPGPDHSASLNPKEFKSLVYGIRQTEKSLGSRIKKPTTEESKNIYAMRRSIVANRDIKAGEIINWEDISFKRPLNGIKPSKVDQIIGRIAKVEIKRDQPISWDHLNLI